MKKWTIAHTTSYFYPRPPRGGRPNTALSWVWQLSISIHALREEGDPKVLYPICISMISIHALREEGDYSLPTAREQPYQFLSTPSARRATLALFRRFRRVPISIHALREEGDPITKPCSSKLLVFLSTPSARRATPFYR